MFYYASIKTCHVTSSEKRCVPKLIVSVVKVDKIKFGPYYDAPKLIGYCVSVWVGMSFTLGIYCVD